MNSPQPTSSRLVFCITELDVGGAEKALVRIASGLQSLGWKVSVVSLRDRGPLALQLEENGIPVTALNCGGFGDVRAIFRLRRYLLSESPAVLLCLLHQANIVGRIAARLVGVPHVLSGVRVADSRRWVVWTDRLTRWLVDHYIAVSESVADVHSRLCKIPASKMTAIPNGVDLPDSLQSDKSQSRPSTERGYRILYVGRLTAQKSPQSLVEAFARLPEAVLPRTTLDLLGDGPARRDLERLIRKYRLSDSVRLLGHRDDVTRRMQSADVLVLPSNWEGLPNVVLEAMANGLPVIATAVDGVRDLIQDGVTGWLVSPGNLDDLARTIATVLEASEQRAVVAANAQCMVAESFTWDKAICHYDQLLRAFTSNEPATSGTTAD